MKSRNAGKIKMAKAYWPEFLVQRLNKLSKSHCLGGKHKTKGAVSPNSGRPLLRLMSLDTEDPKLEDIAWKHRWIELFFSWTCKAAMGEFWYKVVTDSRIEILKFRSGEKYDDFPYEGYPDFFPERDFILRQLTDDEQAKIIRANSDRTYQMRLGKTRPDLTSPRHQIRGTPHLVDEPRRMICPLCGKISPLFAAISSESMCEKPFTDNDYVQVLYYMCVECCVLGCHQAVD